MSRRKIVFCSMLLPAVLVLISALPAGATREPISSTVTYDWFDAARRRKVPVRIYYPIKAGGPWPVIVFSHGLGGSRDGYAYLGWHWANNGYVSVHVQHKGSDRSVWQGKPRGWLALARATRDPRQWIARPKDISFAIDRLRRLNREPGPLMGRLDLSRIGAAGHSFGSYTTLAVAGQVLWNPAGEPFTLADRRVKAAVAMSTPIPRDKSRLAAGYRSLNIPVMHFTGTRDRSFMRPFFNVRDRRLPYEYSRGADKYLIVLIGGDHLVFAGSRLGRRPGRTDAAFMRLIAAATTAFWDAYLKGNPRARKWLVGGGLKKRLAGRATYEYRLQP